MAACSFAIPFSGTPQAILNKARSAVQGQGGTFTGDETAGTFEVSAFGNTIRGSYTVINQNFNIEIDSKPFFLPCSTIENFLRGQLSE